MNLFKTKTLWVGLASILTGVGLIIAGEVPAGINAIVTGIAAICLRDGIAKLPS